MSAPVFRLKGSGWYETDFKSDKEGQRNLAGVEPTEAKAETPDAKAGADDKSAAKPETASAAGDKAKTDSPAKAARNQGIRQGAGREAPCERQAQRQAAGAQGAPAHEGGGEPSQAGSHGALGDLDARAAPLPDQRPADLGAGAGHGAGGALHPAADGSDAAGVAAVDTPGPAARAACAGLRCVAGPADRAAHRRAGHQFHRPGAGGDWRGPARAHSVRARALQRGQELSPRPCCRTAAIPSRRCCWCEYPRAGTWTIGFQTTDHLPEINARLGEPQVCVFIPTTPNPTSGFIIFVPRAQCIELDMHVDTAMKMIVTLGVVGPSGPPHAAIAPLRADP